MQGACIWSLPQLRTRGNCFGFADRYIMEARRLHRALRQGTRSCSDLPGKKRGSTTNVLTEHLAQNARCSVRKVACRRTVSLRRTGVPKPTERGIAYMDEESKQEGGRPAGVGHSSPASKRRAFWPNL